jgi:hypothetical protein
MRKIRSWVVLLWGTATVWIHAAPGQEVATTEQTTPSVAAITDQPFAATKYSRIVQNLPDGKQMIKSERHSIRLARDAAGRMRVEGDNPPWDCEDLTLPLPPKCPVSSVAVFDPSTGAMTHWPEGEMGAHVAVAMNLSTTQLEDLAKSTLAIPDLTRDLDEEGATATTEDLGEKTIEGVDSHGVRTTATLPAGHLGNKPPKTTIHEVWVSTTMHLVMKVIDGDPQNEETISGLEHVTLSPGAALFSPPSGYEVQYGNGSRYATSDIDSFAKWFVK